MTLPGNVPQQPKSTLERLVKLEAKVRAVDKKASNGNGGGSSSPSSNPYAGYVTIGKNSSSQSGYYVNVTGTNSDMGYGSTATPTVSVGANTVSNGYTTPASKWLGGLVGATPTYSAVQAYDSGGSGVLKAYVQVSSSGRVDIHNNADSGGATLSLQGNDFFINGGGSNPSEVTSQAGVAGLNGGGASPASLRVDSANGGFYAGGTNPSSVVVNSTTAFVKGGGASPYSIEAASDQGGMYGPDGSQLNIYGGYVYMKPAGTGALSIDSLNSGAGPAYLHVFNGNWTALTAYSSSWSTTNAAYRIMPDGTVLLTGSFSYLGTVDPHNTGTVEPASTIYFCQLPTAITPSKGGSYTVVVGVYNSGSSGGYVNLNGAVAVGTNNMIYINSIASAGRQYGSTTNAATVTGVPRTVYLDGIRYPIL